MATIIFDIETIGEDFKALDEVTQHSLTRWIKKEARDDAEYEVALADIKDGLGFSPLTGEIVAIGILEDKQNKGAVYYQAPGEHNESTEATGITFKQMSEKEILIKFWEVAGACDTFVSFNGRGFDVPFIITRSAIHGVKPSKDLMSNRYLSSQRFGAKHIDLLDQLSFYGAIRRKGTLHLWSRAFGIDSPKAGGVDGDDVGRLFKEKRFLDIARYNVGDLLATRELYRIWNEYFNFL